MRVNGLVAGFGALIAAFDMVAFPLQVANLNSQATPQHVQAYYGEQTRWAIQNPYTRITEIKTMPSILADNSGKVGIGCGVASILILLGSAASRREKPQPQQAKMPTPIVG